MADVIDVLIAEALGEGDKGLAAVAHVIARRAALEGKTPEQIVNEAGQFSGATNPGRSVAQAMQDPAVRQRVGEIWAGVQNGSIPNPFPNATHFHTPAVSPDWSNSFNRLGQLNNHIFYADPGTLSTAASSPAARAIEVIAPRAVPAAMPTPSSQRPSMLPGVQTAQAPQPANEWLRYTNQNAIRNKPLSDKLVQALATFVPEMGLQVEVFSGGETEDRKASNSGRHMHGDAADVFFYKDGRRLNWANQADQRIFADIVARSKQAGITGIGAGDGYMQPGSMHIGFGAPAVWGAGGKGANAPAWLRAAYDNPRGLIPPGLVGDDGTAVASVLDVKRKVPFSMPTPADQRPGAVQAQSKNTGLDPVQSFIASFFTPAANNNQPAKREMVKSDRPQSYAGQERAGKGEFNPVTAYKPLSAYENQRSPWVPMPLAYPEGKPAPQAKRPISYAAQDAAKPRVPSSALIPKGEMVYTGSRDAKPYAANSGNWAAILAAANQIKAQQAQRQQSVQAPQSSSGGSSGGSSDPYEPPRVSFSGVSTGRTYTEGQKYSMGGDTYVANANGSFTNTRTGKTLVGSSQQRSDEPRSSNSPAQSLVG